MEYTLGQIDSTAREFINKIPWSYCLNAEGNQNGHLLGRIRNAQLLDGFRYLMDSLNTRRDTNCRKSVKKIAGELTSRGILWADVYGDMSEINVIQGTTIFNIFYNKGINVRYLLDNSQSTLSSSVHCTAGVKDIVDLLEFMAKVETLFDSLLKEKCLCARKFKMMSDIEFPFVMWKAREYLEPRGITYEVAQNGDKILLQVHITGNTWMSNRVHCNTIDTALEIIPYLIKRPDRIKADGRGFKVIHI